MAGEDDAAAASRVRRDDVGENGDAAGVEGSERLVEQPRRQLALRREAGEGDAASLALRERADECMAPARETEAVERGVDRGCVDALTGELEQEAQRLGDREVVLQCIGV